MDKLIKEYDTKMRNIKDSNNNYKIIIESIDNILKFIDESENFSISEECRNELQILKSNIKSKQHILFDEFVDLCISTNKLQSICDHDFEYLWHDSHYDYYKCKKCNFEERR